jgi:hypothetical protein
VSGTGTTKAQGPETLADMGLRNERVTRIELAFSAWEGEDWGVCDLGVPANGLVRPYLEYPPVPGGHPQYRSVRSR